jgi:restriction system protein
MIPDPLISGLLSPYCGTFVLVAAGVMVLLLLGFSRRTVSQRRHHRYRKKAARALLRLPQLRDEAARMVWLRRMNPYVFEEMLLTALSRQGLRIRRNTRYSGDGGADGQVWINGQRWLIQAKRYSAAISAAHVCAFGQLAEREGCPGLFVHSGRTGESSREVFRRYDNIILISGQRLLWLLSGDRRWMDGPGGQSLHAITRNHSRHSPSPVTEKEHCHEQKI